MHVKIIFAALWLNLFLLKGLSAQSYAFRHFTPGEGVNSSTVYCSTQDSKGFMWFGTETGVCRFDGKKFTQFSMDDGLSDNEVFQIHEDSKGRMWFLTFNGKLSWFGNDVFHNPENDSDLRVEFASSAHLLSFYEDSKKNIWIGTSGNGLLRIDSTSVSRLRLTESIDDDELMYVLEDSLKNIWGAKSNKLLDIKNTRAGKSIDLPCAMKNCFYMPEGNLLFLGSDGIVYKVNKGDLKSFPLIKLEINPVLVHNLYADPQGNIWLCTTSSGCYKYRYENGAYKLSEQLLKGKTVYSVFVDNENNTWFTTAGEGIYMLPGDYKNHYSFTTSDGLEEMQINSIAKDAAGNIWLGLSNSKINVLTETGLKYFKAVSKLNFYNRVLFIFVDQNNTVWCATDKGLCIFKNGIHSTPEFIDGSKTQSIKNIAQNPVTKEIELTYNGGIIKLVADKSQATGYRAVADTTFICKRTFTHNYDHEGHLWMGNIDGLNFSDGKELVNFGKENRLLQSRITDIKEFHNTLMVIGTYGNGIIVFKNGKIVQVLTTKDELPGNICKQIFIEDSVMWVATNLGLCKLSFDGKLFRVIQNFNSKNGLVSDNVTGVVDDGKRLYVATDRGLSVLNKNVTGKITAPPYVYFTRVTTDDSAYKAHSFPKISFNNHRLMIEFIAVTFRNSSDVKYQYKLNGNVDAWTETRNDYVEFSSLRPGNYVFELRAKKIDSGWSKPTTFNFTIIPPYWETISFRFIAGSIFIFGLYIVIRYYSTRKLRKQLAVIKQKQAIETERSRIATDMHDDLGSDLTKITIWSSIIESENDKIESIKPINRAISSTANSLLKKMDEIIWTLSPTNDTLLNLSSYLHQYALNFLEGTAIRCHVAINDDIPDMDVSSALRRNIFLAFKESLNNVIKHAGANQVGVDVMITQYAIDITIVDNGRGFQTESTFSERHGLTNLRKRLGDIGGSIRIKSEQGRGTIVRIMVPLEKINEPA